MIVLRNARVIPELVEGYEGDRADIVIDEGLIQEIKAPKSVDAGEVLDMTEKTVIPGLIEAHLHLDLKGTNTFEENVQPDAYRTMTALKLAQDNLKMGYTTVRDVGDRNNIIIDLARAVREGYAVGPDILACGKILTPTEMGNDYFGTMYLEADSPAEFQKAVRKQYQRGADWIKLMGTGAVMNPGGEPGRPIVTEEEMKAVCEMADFVGRPVSVHCHGAEGIKRCIRNGVRTIEHSSVMDDECLRMYKASDKSFMIPTLSAPHAFLDMSEGMPRHYVEKSAQMVKLLDEGMREAYRMGIKMGWGTDAGVYEGSHGNGIYEFRLRVNNLGMSPKDTLIQATKNNAEILYIDDSVGTIKAGKKANLAIYNGNPDEDIEVLNDVALVIKDGKKVNL
ncbi:MAG: amidohydrolase family protein [Emergencia sp.]